MYRMCVCVCGCVKCCECWALRCNLEAHKWQSIRDLYVAKPNESHTHTHTHNTVVDFNKLYELFVIFTKKIIHVILFFRFLFSLSPLRPYRLITFRRRLRASLVLAPPWKIMQTRSSITSCRTGVSENKDSSAKVMKFII